MAAKRVKPDKTYEHKIPLVSAVIAIVVTALLVLGATAVIVSHLWGDNSDEGLHLNGTWQTDGPTTLDEYITFEFFDDTFVKTITVVLFDRDIVESFSEYYRAYYDAVVDVEEIDGGNFRLHVTMDGVFMLYGDSILLDMGGGLIRQFSFYWDGDAIIINDERFLRV